MATNLQVHPITGFHFDGEKNTEKEQNVLVNRHPLPSFQPQQYITFTNGTHSPEFPIAHLPVVYLYYVRSMGLGLKAGEFIRNDTLIRICAGVDVTMAEARALHAAKQGDYLVARTETNSINSRDFGNEVRFVNHKCGNYNTKLQIIRTEQPSSRHITVLQSIRDIQAGEVITMNYLEGGKRPEDYPYIKWCKCDHDTHLFPRHWAKDQEKKSGHFHNEDKERKRGPGGYFVPRE